MEIILLFSLLLIAAVAIFLFCKYIKLRQSGSYQTDSILNNIKDGIYRADIDGNLVWVSPSAMKILGIKSLESINGTNIKEFYVYPQRRDELIAKLKEDGRAENFEALLRRMDGTQITVSTNILPWQDNNGNILGITGVFRDITDQKRVEEALIESKTRFRDSLKYSQAILYRLNLKTNKYEYMSDVVYDITGFTPEEMIEMGTEGVNELVHPDDKHLHVGYRKRLIESDRGDQATYYTESRIKGKDGRYRWSGDSHALVRDGQGEPLYIIGCARDITKQKQIEQALKQSELLNRTTINTIDESIHVIDLDMKIILMNKSFLQWCKKLDIGNEFIGKSIFELFPFLPEKVREEYMQVIKTGSIVVTEETSVVGGQSIITETRKIPIKDNGKITRLVTIIRNITKQKLIEGQRKARLELLNNLRHTSDINLCLKLGCKAIYDTRLFERAVLTLHSSEKKIINIGYIGLDAKIVKAAQNAPAPSDELTKQMTQDKFRISNSYFVPQDSTIPLDATERYISQNDIKNRNDISWQSGDELFVPILGESDNIDGWLSVDTPIDLLRPTLETVKILEEIVDIVTQKIREIKAKNILAVKHNALAVSEEKYRNLIDSSPDPIAIYQDSKTKLINPAFVKLLGYKLEEIVNWEGYVKIIAEDDVTFVFDRMNDRLEEKKLSSTFAIDLVAKNGRAIPCEVSLSAIQYQDKPAVYVILRDITERKRIEKEREESERRYRELFDTMLEGVGFVDDKEIIQYCNPSFLKIFEVDSPDMIVGHNLLDFVSDLQKEIILSQTANRKKNISSQYEVEIITLKGNHKTLYISSSPRFDESDKYLGASGAVIDITDQKKTMDALLQSETFSKAIIKYSPIGVSVRSNTGRLLSANDAWINIWGHTEKEIDDFKARDRAELKFDYCDEYLGHWLPDLERIYKEGGYLHIPDVLVTNPRRKVPLYVSQHFYAIKDALGNVDRVVILTEDITERKNVEQKIKLIDSEKLIQAKRIAGTFAHEIRNALFPATASLNRIKLNSRMGHTDAEELNKYSSIAERSITRAADITGLISSFTKLDTEQMPESVNINEIVQELLDNNQLRLLENNVLVNSSGRNDCFVRSNRRQILLALNNLLLNSIDAVTEEFKENEKKKGQINIKWSSNGDNCNILFEDNGCGISSEHLSRIFEPFFSQKSESGGTGIGLAMSKRIIEMYGGTISAKSRLGQGTTFAINLKKYQTNRVDKIDNME